MMCSDEQICPAGEAAHTIHSGIFTLTVLNASGEDLACISEEVDTAIEQLIALRGWIKGYR